MNLQIQNLQNNVENIRLITHTHTRKNKDYLPMTCSLRVLSLHIHTSGFWYSSAGELQEPPGRAVTTRTVQVPSHDTK